MNKLFAVLLGGRPVDSTIEAHNVFFGVAPELESLFPAMKKFWPSAPKIHIDAWMHVNHVDGYEIQIFPKHEAPEALPPTARRKLFFMNLGAYDAGIFEERHKKLLVVACDEAGATAWVKAHDPFFLRGGYTGGKAGTHIDDKKMLEEFEDDSPLDVSQAIEKQGFILRPHLLPHADKLQHQPEVTITGFWRIP